MSDVSITLRGASLIAYPAALDLSHGPVEWGAVLIVTCEGDARCKLRLFIGLPDEWAPSLLKVLRTAGPAFVVLDGTLTERDRVGDSRADYSRKHHRHEVNVQVVADPEGWLLWLSPALPGRSHDLTTARTCRIIRVCARQGVPILADPAYQGADPWPTASIEHRPLQELTPPTGLTPSTAFWPRREHPSSAVSHG